MRYIPIFMTALLLLCLTACKQRNHAADATHEEDYIETVDVDFEFRPMLFVQGDNFQYQHANGAYAPLGIGFLEIIAEQKPVIPLYRTSLCEEAEDSILLHQYPFGMEMFEAEAEVRKKKTWEEYINFSDSIRQSYCSHSEYRLLQDGRFYYQYTATSDTLMPLSWRQGSNLYEYLEEIQSLIYSFPRLRFRVLEMTDESFKVVLNEESGKTAWIKRLSPKQLVSCKIQNKRRDDWNFDLMRVNGIPARKTTPFDYYYISWENYLRMVTRIYLDDDIIPEKPLQLQADSIKTDQGWKQWRSGNKLLIKEIIEFYVE